MGIIDVIDPTELLKNVSPFWANVLVVLGAILLCSFFIFKTYRKIKKEVREELTKRFGEQNEKVERQLKQCQEREVELLRRLEINTAEINLLKSVNVDPLPKFTRSIDDIIISVSDSFVEQIGKLIGHYSSFDFLGRKLEDLNFSDEFRNILTMMHDESKGKSKPVMRTGVEVVSGLKVTIIKATRINMQMLNFHTYIILE